MGCSSLERPPGWTTDEGKEESGVNIELWKLIASIGGVLLTAVTGPIIWAMRAEAGRIRAELALTEGRLRGEMGVMEARIEKQMTEMESRLNTRIDTRLVHR